MGPCPEVLITAGGTREMIDEVRYWSNIFTGRTGLDLALRMLDIADVTLLTSQPEPARYLQAVRGARGSLTTDYFQTHADLERLLPQWLKRRAFQGVFMTAAVSDYQPTGAFEILRRRVIAGHPPQYEWLLQDAQKPKISSAAEEIAFCGRRTSKLIDQFRTAWQYRGLLCKFKLEVGIPEPALMEVAQASRRRSGADVIVANTLEMVRGAEPAAWIIDEAGATRVDRRDLPAALCDYALARLR